MSKEVKERWLAVMDTVHSNSHVVAFMNSRVGQYLDDHPFVALSLMVFIAASAVPIAFFLVFVVSTTVLACIGVIVMEGFVISLGGVTLLCILGGLGMLSLLVSGMLSVCYLSLTTLLSYWPIQEGPMKRENANGSGFVSKILFDEEPETTNKECE
ncbi:promethin [Pseudonaja textilis]|uniref:Lipid droplet assembly factor 1 n=1 Tax=Pseudonaja textilis TaxID=8673 RepID=A0A670XNT7_PSETE|nr:promethin [Pseudonaja textilis]XP_026560064.1 promethin [Pseudonaja textilis]XP_026560065.1 promethin [Pseudonaja textilis]